MESIQDTLKDFKSLLVSASGMDLENASPDYTGGKIVFGAENPADYVGKTLTIDGTTYTFSTTDGDGLINIGAATDGAGVVEAIKNTLPANSEFTYEGDTFSFPLYTVDGVSTVLDVDGVTTGEPHTMSDEQYNTLKTLQTQAFSTMQMIADVLNTNVNGKYIYGGGTSNQAPIDFPFSSLEEFQSYYDGVNVTYPSSAAANLSNRTLTAEDTGNITLHLIEGNQGSITAANAGAFLTQAVDANAQTTGTLTFDADQNTINATQYGAFNTLSAGDTLVLGGDGAGNNAKMYVVKSVSEDGKTITLDDSTALEESFTIEPDNTQADKTVTFSTSYPVGTVIEMNGFKNSNIAPQVQVTGVSEDGTTLYVTADPSRFPDMEIEASKEWSLDASSYYQGSSLSTEKMISENQSITFDINGGDSVFEKIFRALGEIAQGNLVDTANPLEGETGDVNTTLDRITEALDLIQSAIYSSGLDSSENNSDIYTVVAKINSNTVVMNNVQETQKEVQANLENSIYSLKNVDQTEAAIKALMASNNLSASYACLNQVMNVSLLNYL